MEIQGLMTTTMISVFACACFMATAVASQNQTPDPFQAMRHKMVEEQIRTRGVSDPRVLEAMKSVPRHEFVPPALRYRAYEDNPLPIGLEQTISQPYIVALMTEMLEPKPEDKVLEVGTGSGYQAAILAELVGEVYTIEILEPLARRAEKTLQRLGYHNIRIKIGDGWKGWPEAAPFDKIIVTAAPATIPAALVEQLKEGGRMVIPVGTVLQKLLLGVKKNGILETTETIPVRFVPLIQQEERENPEGKTAENNP